jgi:DNA-binding transcriptional LysR family regulator
VELRWVKTFVVVAEELSFRRAAERLYIAQPAVSQQIANLEKFLGLRLLDRDRRGVRLTDAGLVFLPAWREVVKSVEAAELLARNSGSGEYGEFGSGSMRASRPISWSHSSERCVAPTRILS